MAPRNATAIRAAHDAALFQCAYPQSRTAWRAAHDELAEIAAAMPSSPHRARLENSGIAGTAIVGAYSLAVTEWLIERFGDSVRLDSITGEPTIMMPILGAALDPVEQEALAEEQLNWTQWRRRVLGTEPAAMLRRVVALVQRLGKDGHEREAMFAALQVNLHWDIAADAPVLTQGRFSPGGRSIVPALHAAGGGRRTRVTAESAWRLGAPEAVPLDASDRTRLVDLARGAMTSLLRETDFFSWTHVEETMLFDLGRGMQAALFASVPERKLALENYTGYLLLRNGVPIAYGGAWIVGHQARFGINLLPPFRGAGQSARLTAELLRLYGWRFRISVFVVQPYQIGKHNPDGIKSASFWFYYRLGFRPLQPALAALAADEFAALKPDGPRTSTKVLRTLADSTLAWRSPLEVSWHYVSPQRLDELVMRSLAAQPAHDRTLAQRQAVARLGAVARQPALMRLVLLLAAIEPAGGWTDADREQFDRIARLKVLDEHRATEAMQAHGAFMQALQALG